MINQKKKRGKKREEDDLEDEYKPESEKLVEKQMKVISEKMDTLGVQGEVDTSSIPKDLSELETEIAHEQLTETD
ncbi:MAG: hypothetical protein ACC656_04765, partial [Candidatus Heimdallarchaeota archaeon]